mmetsp:Transcript_48384/g.72162  ORF Transcript_48384/g.72162 Transcript_48384/m.72162 type:complete len:158 (-) Transcript_48384:453-926(-)
MWNPRNGQLEQSSRTWKRKSGAALEEDFGKQLSSQPWERQGGRFDEEVAQDFVGVLEPKSNNVSPPAGRIKTVHFHHLFLENGKGSLGSARVVTRLLRRFRRLRLKRRSLKLLLLFQRKVAKFRPCLQTYTTCRSRCSLARSTCRTWLDFCDSAHQR